MLIRLLFLGVSVFLMQTSVRAQPSRIVSLDLCTDWMLARYAERHRVAALSPLNRQFPVPWLDAGWPVHDGTLERILELKPDLVVTGEYNAPMLRDRLKELGLRVEILPLPKNLADVVDYEKRFLALLGRPETQASQPPTAEFSQTHRRLLLLGANGIGTGRGTFEDGILERAGWRNYLEGAGYLRLDLERIVADPPDAVLWAAPGHAALANRYAEHPALRRAVPKEHWLTTDYWRWQCPGPWTWELIRQLRQWRD